LSTTSGSEIEQELYDTGAAINASAVDPASSEIQTRSYPNSSGRQAGTAGYEFIEAMDLVQLCSDYLPVVAPALCIGRFHFTGITDSGA
jgi:hypothetical protein